MDVFNVLGALLGSIALPIVIIVIIYLVANRRNPGPTPERTPLASRDADWRNYIASFKYAPDSPEGRMVTALLDGPNAPDALQRPTTVSIGSAAMSAVSGTTTMATEPTIVHLRAKGNTTTRSEVVEQVHTEPVALRAPIDNTLLLLYFGAFLLVAAAGLFVAFGGFNGSVRTFLTLLTTAALYGGGIWLFGRSSKLQPAGVAFVAIAMAIAPLTGVAAYYYVTGQRLAAPIWALTSLFCIGLYCYALLRLRTSFIAYLVIFSFVSLFESAVAITSAPIQYYIWVLIIAGLVLRAAGLVRDTKQLAGPAAASAQIMIPLGIIVSLALLDGHGLGQLSITLLLSAVYYSFEAYQNREARTGLVLAAQTLYVLGFGLAAYSLSNSSVVVAAVLTLLLAVQAVVITVLPPRAEISRSFASLAFLSALPAIWLTYPNGSLMAIGLVVVGLFGLLLTVVQRRSDAMAGGAAALIALAPLLGQQAVQPALSAAVQTVVSFVPVLSLWFVWRWLQAKRLADSNWSTLGATLYMLAAGCMLIPAALAGGMTMIISCLIVALLFGWSAYKDTCSDWWNIAGIVISLPVLYFCFTPSSLYYGVAVLLALAANSGVTLMSRSELNRWLMTLLGLVAPVALGSGSFGYSWGPVGFSYAYMAIAIGLLYCRCLARGVYAPSSRVPIISLYRSASLSYVVGYVAAAGLAVCISLAASNSRLHTSVIIAIILCPMLFIAIKVERHKQILGLVPWAVAGLGISLIRGDATSLQASVLMVLISATAVAGYITARRLRDWLDASFPDVLQACVALAYLPVIVTLFYNDAALVPAICLAVAGSVTLFYVRYREQSQRELSGAVIVVAGMWGLYSLGIHNLQAYTHIAAATFGLYAYLRHRSGDTVNSQGYLYAMLATATIPLALQSLSGQAGDVYGWWLLLEQIGFMILGILTGRRVVTLWGLYVAIGAVLYQLRNLGWAALSFLALFIIGIAIYRLMRSTEHKP